MERSANGLHSGKPNKRVQFPLAGLPGLSLYPLNFKHHPAQSEFQLSGVGTFREPRDLFCACPASEGPQRQPTERPRPPPEGGGCDFRGVRVKEIWVWVKMRPKSRRC